MYCIYRIWLRFAYKIDNAGILMGCLRARADSTDFSTAPSTCSSVHWRAPPRLERAYTELGA